MAGIEPNLYVRLQETLLKCNEFKSDSQLKAIFVDSRIIPWKNQLSITATPQERVQAVIALLSEQTSHKTSENGLVLLLRVLSKQIDSEAKLHHDLVDLADELETTKLEGKKPKPANEVPTQGSGMEIPDRPGCYIRTEGGVIIAIMLSLAAIIFALSPEWFYKPRQLFELAWVYKDREREIEIEIEIDRERDRDRDRDRDIERDVNKTAFLAPTRQPYHVAFFDSPPQRVYNFSSIY